MNRFFSITPLILFVLIWFASPILSADRAPEVSAKGSTPPVADVNTLAKRFVTAREAGNIKEALKTGLHLLEVLEREIGPDHIEMIVPLLAVGDLYSESEDPVNAAIRYAKAYGISRKELGEVDSQTIQLAYKTAESYRAAGQHEMAMPFHDALVETLTRLGEKGSPLNVAAALTNRGISRRALKKYPDAKDDHEKALAIRREHAGPDDPATAQSLFNLSVVLVDLYNLESARTLLENCVAIRKAVLGPAHPETQQAFGELLYVLDSQSDHHESVKVCRELLQIRKEFEFPIDVIRETKNTLATHLEKSGQIEEAKQILNRLIGEAGDPENPPSKLNVAIWKDNLAWTHQLQGDYQSAFALHKEALTLFREVDGPNGRLHESKCLNMLAGAYLSSGNPVNALAYYQESLETAEENGFEDPDDISSILSNMGIVYAKLGDWEDATKSYRKALTKLEEKYGPESPRLISILLNLGTLHGRMKDFSEEELIFLKALDLSDHFQPGQRYYSMLRIKLALNQARQGKAASARSYLDDLIQSYRIQLIESLESLSERQRMSLLSDESITPIRDLVCSFGSPEQIARFQLLNKGLATESLRMQHLALQKSPSPKATEYRQLRAETFADLLRADATESPQALGQAFAILESFEKELFGNHSSQSVFELKPFKASELELQQQFKDRDAYIDFIFFADESLTEENSGSTVMIRGASHAVNSYGALIGTSSGFQFLKLGKAKEIDHLVDAFRSAVQGFDFANVESVSKALHQRLMLPVRKLLPESATSLVISPDRTLHLISFGALLDAGDRFLSEDYTVTYTESPRSFFSESLQFEATALVVTNPKFDLGEKQNGYSPRNRPGAYSPEELDLIQFDALEGTRLEGEAVSRILQSRGMTVVEMTGSNATERALVTSSSPGILHLATHGYFLAEEHADAESEQGGQPIDWEFDEPDFLKILLRRNRPLVRGGLALAGGKTTIDQWRQGTIPPLDNDGVLLAHEAANLQLEKTFLVVLSACETGVGHLVDGEAVQGIRRMLFQGGSESILMTLWEIPDAETVGIMSEFYQRINLNEGSGLGPELSRIQASWLRKLRETEGAGAAIFKVGAFVIVTRSTR